MSKELNGTSVSEQTSQLTSICRYLIILTAKWGSLGETQPAENA